jgi:hypothetical protein
MASWPRGAGERLCPVTASPLVVTDEQAWAGHHLSLGLSGAYHHEVLSFAEECFVSGRLRT